MIRKLFISIIVLLIAIFTVHCSKNKKEIENIQTELQQLKERIDKIEREVEGSAMGLSYKERGVDREALGRIVFTRSADKEKIREYIKQIMAVSNRQNSFSDEDPQIDLLVKVGEQNINVLIEAARYISFPCVYYVNKAICRLATERSKQLIADELRYNKDLIEVVLKHKWQEYVKNILKEELDRVNQSVIERDRYLPTEWIEAIALLKDPSTYNAFRYYFVNGSNKYMTYKSIKELPGIDIDSHIKKAWEKIDNTNEWDKTMLAIIAVGYGEKDALEILFKNLANKDYSGYIEEILDTIYEHIESKGSNAEIIKWYNKNKSKIYFDHKSKKFRVKT